LKATWHAALVWPDPDWKDAESRLYGLGRLERLLLTLSANGIKEVLLVGDSAGMTEELRRSQHLEHLPTVVSAAKGPVLAIRSGAIFDVRLVPWFAAQLDEQARGVLYTSGDDSRPALFSLPSAESTLLKLDFEAAAQQAGGPRFAPPPGHVCLCVTPQNQRSYGNRELWILTGKPAERWHVRQVRRWLFPLTATLARRGVHPSTVTWVSFWMAVAGCIALAFGGYRGAIAGAVMLYLAWVLDALDGSLSRLTFQASAAGAKLDTDLGRIAYALTGAALGWAIFGRHGNWMQLLAAAPAFTFGACLAVIAGVRAERIPPATRPPGLWRLRIALDNLLHRDNTLILLACALANRLSFFLWFLIVILHCSWIADTAVLLKSRRHGGSSNPPRVPPDPARTVAPL
jgi:phosphatidylglycerophosphate synthase